MSINNHSFEGESYIKSFVADPYSAGNTPDSRSNTGDKSRAISRSKAVSLGPTADQVICTLAEGRGVATVVGICFLIPSTCEMILCHVYLSIQAAFTTVKEGIFLELQLLKKKSWASFQKKYLSIGRETKSILNAQRWI